MNCSCTCRKWRDPNYSEGSAIKSRSILFVHNCSIFLSEEVFHARQQWLVACHREGREWQCMMRLNLFATSGSSSNCSFQHGHRQTAFFQVSSIFEQGPFIIIVINQQPVISQSTVMLFSYKTHCKAGKQTFSILGRFSSGESHFCRFVGNL